MLDLGDCFLSVFLVIILLDSFSALNPDELPVSSCFLDIFTWSLTLFALVFLDNQQKSSFMSARVE